MYVMATKHQLTKTTVGGTAKKNLYMDGVATPVQDMFAVKFPVMPDLLSIVEDYFDPDDIRYKDAVVMAEEIALLTRAYYLQFASFFHKNEKEVWMRRALQSLHERFCKIPHPYIDQRTKEYLKLKEDNYERIIVRENPRNRGKRLIRS